MSFGLCLCGAGAGAGAGEEWKLSGNADSKLETGGSRGSEWDQGVDILVGCQCLLSFELQWTSGGRMQKQADTDTGTGADTTRDTEGGADSGGAQGYPGIPDSLQEYAGPAVLL